MHVLVTGGAGFIGSSVSEELLRSGHLVTVVDNLDPYYNPEVKRRNLDVLRSYEKFAEEQIDMLDFDSLNRVFRRTSPETVIHLAARPGVRDSIRDPRPYIQTNVEGTANVLEAAAQSKVNRFIYSSSSSVYGSNGNRPSQESDRPAPASPYAASKLCGEILCESYHLLRDLPIVCLRLFTVFGPRQRPDMAIHKFTRSILSGTPVPLFDAQNSARDYTFIEDVVRAFIASCKIDAPWSVINIGSGRPIGLDSLVRTLAKVLDREPLVEHHSRQTGEPRLTFADISRASELIGFRPAVTFEEGIGRFADWFSESGAVMLAGN